MLKKFEFTKEVEIAMKQVATQLETAIYHLPASIGY